ncbi:unnamed protein product [Knipowitschia caucasica]
MSRDQRGLVYLVSGGCGFLGKHLLRVLLEQERGKVSEIRLFDKMIDSSLEEHSTESMKVVVIQGDITDYSQVQEASREVDVFIHSASLVDVWHKVPESVIYGVNVRGSCWSVLVRAGPCWSVLVCAGLCWSVLVCAGLCWSVLVCAGLCWSVLVRAGPCWSVLVCAGPCWSVLVRAGPC